MINLEENEARSQSRNLAFCIPCFLLHLLQLHCLVGYESIDSIIRIINISAKISTIFSSLNVWFKIGHLLRAANLVKEVLCADIKGTLHSLHDDDDDDEDGDGDDNDIAYFDLHLLLHVPQLLFVLLRLGLVGRLDIGDSDQLFLYFYFHLYFHLDKRQ